MDSYTKGILIIGAIIFGLMFVGIYHVYAVLLPAAEAKCMEQGGYRFDTGRDGSICWREDGTRIFLK